MKTVIGFMRSDFTAKDSGEYITGYNIYVTYPLMADEFEGIGCERIYMTDKKLAMCGYKPAVGDEVVIAYNRFAKPTTITRIKD